MKHAILSTVAVCAMLFASSCTKNDSTTPAATYGTITYGSNTYTITDVSETSNTTLYDLAGDGTTPNGTFALDVVVDTVPTSSKVYSIGTGRTTQVHVSTSVGSAAGDNLYFGKPGEKITGSLFHDKVMLSFDSLTEVDLLGVPKAGSSTRLTGAIVAK